jgi:hypothetical protein
MSVRGIADATGLPRATVGDAVQRVRNRTPGDEPTKVAGKDGKLYPSAAATRRSIQLIELTRPKLIDWPHLPMRPYFEDEHVRLYNARAEDWMPMLPGVQVVSDPPWNIDFGYRTYRDHLSAAEYAQRLRVALRPPSVVVHLPEGMFVVARALGLDPEKVVAWVFHSNLPRQTRSIGWFGVAPDLTLLRQAYRNPTDQRVQQYINAGSPGARSYDWWEVEQEKGPARARVDHPAVTPHEIMRRILMVTPATLVVDPFSGTSTTLIAARALGRRAIGFEVDPWYCEASVKRLEGAEGSSLGEAAA